MFIAKTRGFAIDSSVLSGDAFYTSTQRGMSMKASFVSLYTRYAASHITPSMEMGVYTVMLTLLSRYPALYVFVMTTWHVWFAIACITLSPWFFHPQSFKEGMVELGVVEWACWLMPAHAAGAVDPKKMPHGTWWQWHSARLRALRAMPSHTKIEYIVYRVLPIPTMLLFASCAALRVDDIMTKPTLRSIIIVTAGIAGVMLSVVYYWATSPSFLWPTRVVDVANRLGRFSEVQKNYVVIAYGVVCKIVMVRRCRLNTSG